MRARSNRDVFTAFAAAAALAGCGSGGTKVAESTAGLEVAPTTVTPTAMYRANEILAYRINGPGDKVVGRAHSTFSRSEEGFSQVVTRVVYGPGDTAEHATTFRSDLSPVFYKRLSSTSGRYQLKFRDQQIQVTADKGTREVASRQVKTVLVPDGDLMMLSIALADERLKPGDSVKMDVFSADALKSSPWSVRSYADASRRLVVELPNGRAIVGDRGRIERFEQADGKVFAPEVPPGEAPRVEWSPPLDYHRPDDAPFSDREAVIEVAGGQLAGILSIPRDRSRWAKGLAPGVVLVSDDGPHDRHGFSGKMDYGTWDLLDRLASAGVAVLRVDDRGVGASTSTIPASARTLALAEADTKAMIRFMERQPEVHPDGIVLVGHGHGAQIAVSVARHTPVSGLVVLAMPFRHVPFSMKLETVLSAFERPVAVFQGLTDFQVSWREDAKRIMDALKRSPARHKSKLFAYDRVDHLMKTEPKQSSYERYADRSRRIDPRVTEDLVKWIAKLRR